MDESLSWEAMVAALRRMREAEGLRELAAVLAETAGRLAPRTAVLLRSGTQLRLAAVCGFEPVAGTVEAALGAAPALAQAVKSGDCVVAIHTPTELSVSLARALPAKPGARVILAPLAGRRSTHGVLYAEAGAEVSPAPFEALAAAAGLAADSLAGVESAPAGLVALKVGPQPAGAVTQPADQAALELDESARRFARVKVAAILERRSQAVKEGRAAGDLYRRLQREIDAARAEYKEQFLEDKGFQADYFHEELVRTLADDDASLLGPDYPGPLV